MKRILPMLLCLALAVSLLAACGSSAAESTAAESAAAESEETQSEEAQSEEAQSETQTTVTGRVTAIDGDTYTLQVNAEGEQGGLFATEAEGQPSDRPGGEEGGQAPALPEGEEGNAPADLPEGEANGEAPDRAQGGEGRGREGGEEITVTLTAETVVEQVEAEGNAEATLEEITVGSLIQITQDGDTVVSVLILTAQEGEPPQDGEPSDKQGIFSEGEAPELQKQEDSQTA